MKTYEKPKLEPVLFANIDVICDNSNQDGGEGSD